MNDDVKRLRKALAKIAEVAADAAGKEYRDDPPEEGDARGAPSKRYPPKRARDDLDRTGAFRRRRPEDASRQIAPRKHVYGHGVVCKTDHRGYATPDNRDRVRIRVDATEGFIPLWAKDVTLRWRFNESSMLLFEDPEAAKALIEELFSEAIAAWDDAVPVRFAKRNDAWDFEFVMQGVDDCDDSGCALAAAFFPDGGRHQVDLYPKLVEQDRQELVETLIHEFGHVFGLRHFFANVRETAWPSELFGSDEPFSIMNYGPQSVLTDTDKRDLKRLYEAAWSGDLTHINGTPIRLVTPFHTVGDPPCNLVAGNALTIAVKPNPVLPNRARK